MTYSETRKVGYAFAGSLAVHLALAVIFALWIGLVTFPRIHLPEPAPAPEPEVTLVFPDLPPPPPTTPQKKDESYIRTTQNTEAEKAPENPAFVSDKNTVAGAKSAPDPDGDKPLPNMKGVDYPTNELANRTYRDGQTKNDSAPAPPKASAATAVVASAPPPPPPPPPSPPPATPQMKQPEPPQMAKKEDAPAEKMMKELDTALAQEKQSPVEPKMQDKLQEPSTPDPSLKQALPLMRTPDENSAPRAMPVASPVMNTSRAEKDAFQPETHVGAVKGTISNVGAEDAVSAVATPVGRYMRQVTGAIEKKWHQYRLERADAVEPGKMGLRFFVNKNGKVEDLEFLFKESNPLMEDFTIEAILKADIPPIPKDLLPILDKERVEITYDIVIHP